MKPKEIGQSGDDEVPLAHKLYEAHILRDNFKEKISNFLEDNDTSEIILEEIVDSPLKVDILEKLSDQIVGQDEAKRHLVDSIINAIETVKDKESGPLKVLFFAGNTGVGKTETARVLSEICFGYKRGVTIVPCEQFNDGYTVRNLLGSTKGYVGYGESTPISDINLFKAYREAKQSKKLHESLYRLDDFAILVFDEIEKAHTNVKQAMLGILSSGIHEFSSGIEENPKECKHAKITDFKNVIIIFTSNIGTKEVQKRTIGFGANEENKEYERKTKIFEEEMKKHFSPEFLGRIDEVIYFHDLSEEHCRKILKNELNVLNESYGMCYDFRVKVELSEEAIKHILKEGFDTKTGARKMKRVIFKNIENRINNYLVGGGMEYILPNNKVLCFEVDYRGDSYIYRVKKQSQTVTSQAKITNLVQYVLQKKQANVVHNALHPDIMKIMPEILFLQDRYRRIYHLFVNKGIPLEKEMKIYEFMLRELGHTEEDLQYQQKLVEHEIFEPKDVFLTYSHNCDFLISNSIFYFAEDEVVSELVDKIIKRYPHMSEEKLRHKVFRNIEFLFGTGLNTDQATLLHDMISVKIGREE